MQIEGDEEVLTLKQAGERVNRSPSTLYQQIRNGALRGRLMGKTWLITASELRRYEEQIKQPRGFAREDHPLHGKRGGGGRRKKEADV